MEVGIGVCCPSWNWEASCAGQRMSGVGIVSSCTAGQLFLLQGIHSPVPSLNELLNLKRFVPPTIPHTLLRLAPSPCQPIVESKSRLPPQTPSATSVWQLLPPNTMLRQHRERQFQAGLHAPAPEEDRTRLFESPPPLRNRHHDASPHPTVNSLPTRHRRRPLRHITNSFRTLFQRDRRRRVTFL